VGSTDGYLYALDACSLGVRWSKFLGASVAEPVIGDTDGDGADEIMVGTADGFIAHLDIPKCASPKSVIFPGEDPSVPRSLAPGELLEVSFDTVDGASGYEYAL